MPADGKRGPGRPTLGPEARVRPTVVKLSAIDVALIDSVRGDTPRGEFIRDAALAEVEKRRGLPLDPED